MKKPTSPDSRLSRYSSLGVKTPILSTTNSLPDENILIFLDDLIRDYKDQTNLKKIESLEQKLINNLDENSYSELIKLKSQLNRE